MCFIFRFNKLFLIVCNNKFVLTAISRVPFLFTLGTLELNLNHMPKPAKKSSACSLDQLPDLSRGMCIPLPTSTSVTGGTANDSAHSASAAAIAVNAMSPSYDNNVNAVKAISLFEQKRIRGFWPCYNDEDNKRELTVRSCCSMKITLLNTW